MKSEFLQLLAFQGELGPMERLGHFLRRLPLQASHVARV
jgi:hypothetical protein